MGEYYFNSYSKHQYLAWDLHTCFCCNTSHLYKRENVLSINKMEIYEVNQVWDK